MSEQNRFLDLEPVLIELGEALDDPDSCGTPEDFIKRVQELTNSAAEIAASLALEDFEAEYEENENEGVSL